MAPTSNKPVATTDRASRTFSMSLDINATPEDIWRALTDAGELVRWFPLQARVTPGQGGSVFWGWYNPGRDLFVRVDDLEDGVFRLSTWHAGGQTGLQVWMTTYDARHAERVREFGARAQQLVEQVFR